MIIAYTDGACLGNPGPMGIGIVIYRDGVMVEQLSEFIGDGTNNMAEYKAIIKALETAHSMGETVVHIKSDSELVVKQLNREYRVKDPGLVLSEHLSGIPEIEVVGKTNDPANALNLVERLGPDLLFLDIEMPGKSGFEVLDELYREGLRPDVIFVTAFNIYAIRAIRYAAFDYLLKPVLKEELQNAIARLKQSSLSAPGKDEQIRLLRERVTASRVLKINSTGGFVLINPDDILFVRADWNYAEIHFDDNSHETVTLNIGTLEEMLPPGRFFRISRSVIINTLFLKRVNRKKRTTILVKEGKEFDFRIPLLNIRKLERFLEGG